MAEVEVEAGSKRSGDGVRPVRLKSLAKSASSIVFAEAALFRLALAGLAAGEATGIAPRLRRGPRGSTQANASQPSV